MSMWQTTILIFYQVKCINNFTWFNIFSMPDICLDLIHTGAITTGRSYADWPLISCDKFSGHCVLHVCVMKTFGQPTWVYSQPRLPCDMESCGHCRDSMILSLVYLCIQLCAFFFLKIILNTKCLPCLPQLTHHYWISHLFNGAQPLITNCEYKSNSQYWANLSIIMNQLTLNHRHIIIDVPCNSTWQTSSSEANGLPVQLSMICYS